MEEEQKAQFPEIDFITMGCGHSNIIGHVPEGKFSLGDVGAKQVLEQKDVASLGLFDSSTPNYTTYYPDVTAEDLAPKDAEFIYPVFRMLSNVVVHKRHNPIEFPESVLKESMKQLVGQTINVDHETALGNAIGAVVEVEWQESYKDKSGVTVPGGINAKLKIDGKSNPRIARGILMDPPAIHSNSVTVRFKWEPSHTFEDQDEFWRKLGTFDADGELVRRVATEVVAYAETSLVNHGADPYAKLIKDGKIVNPKMAQSFYSFKAENGDLVNESKYYSIDYKDIVANKAIDVVSNSATQKDDGSTTLNDVSINQSNKYNMKESLLKLCLIMGITDETTLTEDNWLETVSNHVTGLDAKVSDSDSLQTKVTELTEANATLTSEAATLKANASVGETALKGAQDEALRMYNLAKGDDADADMQKVIGEATYANAMTFQKQFANDADGEFAHTCNDCQSTNVSRATAEAGAEGEAANSDATVVKNKSNEEVKALALKRKQSKASFTEDEPTA